MIVTGIERIVQYKKWRYEGTRRSGNRLTGLEAEGRMPQKGHIEGREAKVKKRKRGRERDSYKRRPATIGRWMSPL